MKIMRYSDYSFDAINKISNLDNKIEYRQEINDQKLIPDIIKKTEKGLFKINKDIYLSFRCEKINEEDFNNIKVSIPCDVELEGDKIIISNNDCEVTLSKVDQSKIFYIIKIEKSTSKEYYLYFGSLSQYHGLGSTKGHRILGKFLGYDSPINISNFIKQEMEIPRQW